VSALRKPPRRVREEVRENVTVRKPEKKKGGQRGGTRERPSIGAKENETNEHGRGNKACMDGSGQARENGKASSSKTVGKVEVLTDHLPFSL